MEYKWFNDYVKHEIGIVANGRLFYPTRRPVHSCKNCQFLCNNQCDINVEFDLIGQPYSNCFPCKSNKYAGRGDEIQGDSLRVAILELCQKEDDE